MAAAVVQAQSAVVGQAWTRDAWPRICERFALQILGHAESLRPVLDRLEADEHDGERLKWLYQIDHSVTRLRRVARDLRVLAGIEGGDPGGCISSLTDVIRAAESSIEHYSKVVIGRVVELAVVPYVADDLSSLLAALLDNATNHSPSTVTISAHLLDSGSVMVRIEDSGTGILPAHIEVLNAALAGPVPDVDERTAVHTGFPVVHRLARKHGLGVRLASRPDTGGPGGTVAMVTIPPDVLCEVPQESPAVGGPVEPAEPAETPEPPSSFEPPERPHADGGPPPSHPTAARPSPLGKTWNVQLPVPNTGTAGGLPRRTRSSLRGEGSRNHGRTPGTDTYAAARSFADDVTAFTAGGKAARAARPAGSGKPTVGPDALAGPANRTPRPDPEPPSTQQPKPPQPKSPRSKPSQLPTAQSPTAQPGAARSGAAPRSEAVAQPSARPDSAARSNPAGEVDRPDQADSAGRPDQAGVASGAGQASEPRGSDQAGEGEASGSDQISTDLASVSDGLDQAGAASGSGQVGAAGRSDQVGATGRPGQAGAFAGSGRAGLVGGSDLASASDGSDQAGAAGGFGRAGVVGGSGPASASDGSDQVGVAGGSGRAGLVGGSGHADSGVRAGQVGAAEAEQVRPEGDGT